MLFSPVEEAETANIFGREVRKSLGVESGLTWDGGNWTQFGVTGNEGQSGAVDEYLVLYIRVTGDNVACEVRLLTGNPNLFQAKFSTNQFIHSGPKSS